MTRSEFDKMWEQRRLTGDNDQPEAAKESVWSFVKPSSELCRIYFGIAAECIGAAEVRKRRDTRIANAEGYASAR